MKSGYDISADIRALINVPEVTNQLTGRIWQYVMPGNSKNTEVVINVIAATNEWMQQSVVNVNIHAPNAPLNIGGKIENNIPDLKTLVDLGNLIQPFLADQYKNDFHCHIERPAMLKQDEDNSWYVNIRVKYYSIQNNFKNI